MEAISLDIKDNFNDLVKEFEKQGFKLTNIRYMNGESLFYNIEKIED